MSLVQSSKKNPWPIKPWRHLWTTSRRNFMRARGCIQTQNDGWHTTYLVLTPVVLNLFWSWLRTASLFFTHAHHQKRQKYHPLTLGPLNMIKLLLSKMLPIRISLIWYGGFGFRLVSIFENETAEPKIPKEIKSKSDPNYYFNSRYTRYQRFCITLVSMIHSVAFPSLNLNLALIFNSEDPKGRPKWSESWSLFKKDS